MKTIINKRRDKIQWRTDSECLLVELNAYNGVWEVGSYGSSNSFKLDALESFAHDMLVAIQAARLVIHSGVLPDET